MKPDEYEIGHAIRVEVEESTGRLFLVFEITDQKHINRIKLDWSKDIEFVIKDKELFENE